MPLVGKLEEAEFTRTFEWRIDDFFSLSEEDGKRHYSSQFLIDGEYWFLGIYPNGDSKDNSVGYIDVYLFRFSPGPSRSMAWTVSLKTVDGKKYFEQQGSHVFTKEEGWGFPKILKRSELKEKKSTLVPNGVLTIVCTIESCSKSTTYNTDNPVKVKCSDCKEKFDAKFLPSHKQKCLNKPIRCPTCNDVVELRNWFDHECPQLRAQDNPVKVKCSDCNEKIYANSLPSHKQKCKPIRCPTCSDVVELRKWFDHECPQLRAQDNPVKVKCSDCKEKFDAKSLPSHKQKCLNKPIRCPTCNDVVELRNWFDHECPQLRAQDNPVKVKCSDCNEKIYANSLPSHKQKCKPIRCPTCSDVVELRKWFDHECPQLRAQDNPVKVKCSDCKEKFDANSLPSHKQKCLNKPIRCPTCNDVVELRNWFDHECPQLRAQDNPAKAKCSDRKEEFDAKSLPSHKQKCLNKPIRCPTCSDVVELRNWFDHECLQLRTQESTEGIAKQESQSSPSTSKSSEDTVQYPLANSGNKKFCNHKDLFFKYCDVIIKVKEQEFQAHRGILSARSTVFASILRNDPKDGTTETIDIEDCDPATFSEFLCFIYTGKVENLSTANVFDLFTLADKYQVEEFRAACLEFIKNNLSVDIFCDSVALAVQHSEKELIRLAADFFTKHFEEISVTEKLKSLLIKNPIADKEIMIKALVLNK